MTSKKILLAAVLPQKASKAQALDVVQQAGILGVDDESRAWLETYFSENAKPDSSHWADAVKVADAIYDHISANWIAAQFGVSIHELATDILGVEQSVECGNEGCEKVFQAAFRRVKGGYSIMGHRIWTQPRNYPYFCPDCKSEYNARKTAEQKANAEHHSHQQRETAAKEEALRRQEEQRKFTLAQCRPGDHPGDFLDLVVTGADNELRRFLSQAVSTILSKTVSVVGETSAVAAKGARVRYGMGHYDLKGLAYPRCERCHQALEGTADYLNIQFLIRDMRLARLSYFQQEVDVLREHKITALDALIEFGVESFSGLVLRDWVRGLIFGSPNVMFLCAECSPPDEIRVGVGSFVFYKIIPLIHPAKKQADDD